MDSRPSCRYLRKAGVRMTEILYRIKRGRRSHYLLAVVALIALLAGCATTDVTPDARQPVAPRNGPVYVVTVELAEGDTPESVAAHLGGEVIVWQESQDTLEGEHLSGYAIVGVDEAPLAALSADGTAVIEPNQGMLLGGGEMAFMNGRSSLWAGGRSSLWAGGRSSLWAGGRSSLWAGGRS